MLLMCCGMLSLAVFSVLKTVLDKVVLSALSYFVYIWTVCSCSFVTLALVGNFFVGALAYADDLALLSPSASAMHTLLKICDEYSKQFSIVFNAAKSACLLVAISKSLQRRMKKPEFYIGGKLIDFVNEYTHLSHIISDCMDDKHDILFRRNTLCGKINNVMCFFCQQSPAVQLRLMCRYCSDHYGGVLWEPE